MGTCFCYNQAGAAREGADSEANPVAWLDRIACNMQKPARVSPDFACGSRPCGDYFAGAFAVQDNDPGNCTAVASRRRL